MLFNGELSAVLESEEIFKLNFWFMMTLAGLFGPCKALLPRVIPRALLTRPSFFRRDRHRHRHHDANPSHLPADPQYQRHGQGI
jgi:hypothetical protein